MDALVTADGLSLKEERFAQAVSTGTPQGQAYADTHDAHHWSPNSIAVQASRLMDRPKILLRINDLVEEALSAAQVTPDWIVKRAKTEAISKESDASAHSRIRALELLSKIRGMLVDRSEHVIAGALVIDVQMSEGLSRAKHRALEARPKALGLSEVTDTVASLGPESDASASSGDEK